jgi:TolB-like protein
VWYRDHKEAAETLVASYITEGGIQDDLTHLVIAACLIRLKAQTHLSALLFMSILLVV